MAKILPKTEYQKILNQDKELSPNLFKVGLQHPDRNRFSNVLPNEPTRVKLNNEENFYFNANWVDNKNTIVCQGPLKNEVDIFWKMIWHTETAAIVMLANPMESGQRKCSEYWKSPLFSSLFSNISVNCISEKVIFAKDNIIITKRTIELNKGNEKKKITQYHLQNWPDFGVIKPKTLAHLVKTVSSENNRKRIAVHCSAGLGRSGAFTACYLAFKTQSARIYDIVLQLRNPYTGRVGMIQTEEQYTLARDAAKLLLEQ